MRISSKSSVYPITAVATVEVLQQRAGRLISIVQLGFLRVLLIALGGYLRQVTGQFAALVNGYSVWFIVGGTVFLLLSVLLGLVCFKERTLHVVFLSGDSLKIPTMDKTAVWEMRKAVEKALVYSQNQALQGASVADELGKLAELRSRGVIDDVDWERAKDLFMGKLPSAQEQTVRQLRQLHDLHTSGVLSESEFNMKKWDVLAQHVFVHRKVDHFDHRKVDHPKLL